MKSGLLRQALLNKFMGAIRLSSDKLFTSNNITGTNKIIFSVLRYSNVFAVVLFF